MVNIQMGLELVLSGESNVAFLLADIIRTQEMRETKVLLQRVIVVVEHVTVCFTTQMTRQMHPVQMIMENSGIKEELFTEIAPRMRQYLCATITRWITVFNMIAQLLHVIDSLLSDKDSASFQTHQTEGLLM